MSISKFPILCYTPPMDQVHEAEDYSKNSTGYHSSWFLWTAIMLPLIYFLSTGPVVKLRQTGRISPGAVLTIYAPLIQLSQICPPLDNLLKWYVRDVWKA